MPVRYYIGRDMQGRESPPDFSQEVLAVIDIIKMLYESFNHSSNYYAILANLNKVKAKVDMLIVSELGIGVIELKHYYGLISQNQHGEWLAGSKKIYGHSHRGYKNPHEQVQLYAKTLRNQLIKFFHHWENFTFNTAVCFTHPDAQIDNFRNWYRRQNIRERWENFAILSPDEVANWTMALRFEHFHDHTKHFQSFRLSPQEIEKLVTTVFNATAWTDLDKLMPTGQPYAYLSLQEAHEVKILFSLRKEHLTIGRSTKCDMVVPLQYSQVSRLHGKIRRLPNGVMFEDCSANGTFINGEHFHGKMVPLRDGQKIYLGASDIDQDGICTLEFSFEASEVDPTVGKLV